MSITDAIPGVAEGKLIIAGIALAGIAIPTIGWTVTAHTLKGARQTIALDKANMAAESNAHQVTIQSLDQCNAQLASKSAESDARAKAFEQSKAIDANAIRSADDRQAADKGRRDTLTKIAANSPDSGCRAPTALTDSLRGL